MRRAALIGALLLGVGPLESPTKPRLLDGFEEVSGWKAAPSDGVRLSIGQTVGFEGRAMRLDFDFQGGGGYAVARKAFVLELPENYEFSFRIRGQALPNNLEFKLIDPSGDNVWWVNRRGFDFPADWRKVTLKKRHIEFAWGPAGGGEMKRAAAIEFAVTAGRGGRGWVAIDELTFTELPPAKPYDRTPSASAASSAPGHPPDRAADGDPKTSWLGADWLALDFLEKREYGGLTIQWERDAFASRYEVQISENGKDWSTLRSVAGGNGGRDDVYLPETESRHLRFRLGGSAGIREVIVRPLSFSESPTAFFEAIAKEAPRGAYPRYFWGEQSYWTVVGVDGNAEEGLVNEDGALEMGLGRFSIEPFLYHEGTLVTWSEVEREQALVDGYLPVPSVRWRHGGLSLEITAFAAGTAEASRLYARYRVKNGSAKPLRPKLFLALRPFQVNPPWQFLGVPGGFAPIEKLSQSGGSVSVNGGERTVTPIGAPAAFGAASFDQGEITEFLARGKLPPSDRAADALGFASGAFSFDLDLIPGAAKDVWLIVPFQAAALASADPEQALAETVREWRSKLGGCPSNLGGGPCGPRRPPRGGPLVPRSPGLGGSTFRLPPAAEPLVRTLRSNLAYILINRDGAAIQPGSRSYDRSWIRDGALTSAALLRLGHEREVRDFLAWYAPFQYLSGKVPCCVDDRGADPVPENDSHGELIYAIGEYYRFTNDLPFLWKMWPHVEKAVGYLETLRRQRRAEEYRTPGKIRFFGLLPESISHEGYSAKPVHSFWDDFWALTGFKDAVFLARALGKEDLARRYEAARDEFREDLYASLSRTISEHGLEYLPGSVELADFDPTSTTIALSPAGETANLPEKELLRTFERYWEDFARRRSGTKEWQNYTPYELRNVGAFVRLGWRERAWELLDFFMKDRRPAAWNHWAEVVWRDPGAGKFIGDMPHTWVGSDFIRSFLDLFAYVRQRDEALVLGAGIPEEWARSPGGVAVTGLRTEYGRLDFSLAAKGRRTRLSVSGDLRMPPGGIAVAWSGKETVLRKLPGQVLLP